MIINRRRHTPMHIYACILKFLPKQIPAVSTVHFKKKKKDNAWDLETVKQKVKPIPDSDAWPECQQAEWEIMESKDEFVNESREFNRPRDLHVVMSV